MRLVESNRVDNNIISNLLEEENEESTLDRSSIMSDVNVVDICNTFSSRNHLKYKIEGNSAVYEDGTVIKFIVNDDSEIEYYFINSQGDASKSAPVYDWSLLDLVTEEPINESDEFETNSGASETLKLIYDELKMISEDGIHFVDTDIDTLICYALDLRAQAENLVDELRSLK